MKKYKLIKEYPGSPKLETTVDLYESIHYNPKKYFYKIPNNSFLDIENVENYPEYWQEVIQKEYEILSISVNKGKINSHYKNGKFKWDTDTIPKFRTLEEILKNHIVCNITIHSIKRLSDSEVFTIGDLISHPDLDNQIKIESFDFSYTELLMFRLEQSYRVCLNNKIRKVKKPLFTTEDGVDIFNKTDKFVWINKSTFELRNRFDDNQKHNLFFVYEPDKELYFSTKEAAEEYILMNKPCLSINDINCPGFKTITISLDTLKEFVKNKLN